MREIILDDNYLKGLNQLNPEVHTESNIYYKDRTLYKVFTGEGYNERTISSYLRKKEKKVELISTFENLPHVILPQDKLVKIERKRKIFAGYSMEFLDSSITLYEASRCLDFKSLFNLLKRISVTLKKIHKRSEGIVIGDLSYFNILISEIDSLLDYFFIDFDNVTIGKMFQSERIAPLTKDYTEYRSVRLKINKNFDRLTFLLYFLDAIFEKTIIEVSMYEYDEMCEKINVLKDLRNLVIDLKRTEGAVPSVPYLHEIDSSFGKTLKKVS